MVGQNRTEKLRVAICADAYQGKSGLTASTEVNAAKIL